MQESGLCGDLLALQVVSTLPLRLQPVKRKLRRWVLLRRQLSVNRCECLPRWPVQYRWVGDVQSMRCWVVW